MTTDTTPTLEAPTNFVPNRMPATIFLVDGQVFVIPDVDAWGYIEQGVFATGHFTGEETELDLVIYADRISHISLDFASLKQFLTAGNNENPGA